MVIKLIKKELSKLKDKQTKLLYLRRLLKRIDNEGIKKEIRKLIDELTKEETKTKEEFQLTEKGVDLKKSFIAPDILEEPSATRFGSIVEEDEIKYEPSGNLERRLGHVTSRERREEEQKEVKYILTKDIYDIATSIGESALAKAVKDDLKLQKAISREQVGLSPEQENLVRDEVRKYIVGAPEERILAESKSIIATLKYETQKEIISPEDKILQELGFGKKKEKRLYKEEGIV